MPVPILLNQYSLQYVQHLPAKKCFKTAAGSQGPHWCQYCPSRWGEFAGEQTCHLIFVNSLFSSLKL